MKSTSLTQLKNIAEITVAAALTAVCSWITVPYTVPFTMQTFAVFFILLTLGGKRGTLSVIIYILLGAVGAPVFSSFRSGIGTLFGPTGGYIFGFVFIGIIYLIFEKKAETGIKSAAVLTAGLLVCYAFGTAQFVFLMKSGESAPGVIQALMMCVIPYIIPDLVKLAIAVLTAKRVKKALKL